VEIQRTSERGREDNGAMEREGGEVGLWRRSFFLLDEFATLPRMLSSDLLDVLAVVVAVTSVSM
jgi:hypothetical protein